MNALLRLFRAVLDHQTPTARSEGMLRANLTADQLSQLDAHGYFEVLGGESGHRFRVCRSPSINVEEFDEAGASLCRWCLLPTGMLPEGDVLLAQKIAIELFESEARAIANVYPARLCRASRFQRFDVPSGA